MSNLFSLLNLGSSGLAAQNSGAGVAAQNAANVNTEGYSRERVDLRAEIGPPTLGGVRTGKVQRYQDNLLAGRLRSAAGSLGASTARHSALLGLEQAVIGNGATVDDSVAALFSRFEQVSAAPADPNTRSATINAARDLAGNLNTRATAVASARGEADSRIKDSAKEATALARSIAASNKALVGNDDPVLRDRRDLDAKRLSELVGGSARIDPDGHMRFVLEGGGVLVDGARSAALETSPGATPGASRVEVVDGTGRHDVTASLTTGAIGADLQFRDVTGARVAGELDQLAFDLATSVNAVHRANAGTNGVTGRDFFTAPAAVAGAAAALAVDPALIADPSRLATAAPGAGPSDNTGARALLAIRDQPVANGGTQTLLERSIGIGAAIGHDTADAEAEVTRDSSIAEHLAGLRDSLAGVDLDEELANLSKFQHAAEAMTKFIGTVDSMLGNLIQNL